MDKTNAQLTRKLKTKIMFCNHCGKRSRGTICTECLCGHGRLKMLCDKCNHEKHFDAYSESKPSFTWGIK